MFEFKFLGFNDKDTEDSQITLFTADTAAQSETHVTQD